MSDSTNPPSTPPSKSNSSLARIKAEKLVAEGDKLQSNREYEAALAKYHEAIALDPTYDWSYVEISRIHGKLNDDEKSLAILTEGIAAGETARLFDNRGDVLVLLKKFDEAFKDFDYALKLDPSRHSVFSSIADAYSKLSEFDNAIEYYKKNIESDPTYAYAYAKLGRIVEQRGNLTESLSYFEKADGLESKNGNDVWSEDLRRVRGKLRKKDQWTELPTIEEMLAYLDRFVCGQETAKLTLVTAVYNHYFSLAYQEEDLMNTDLGRFNTLIFGPSGCGKTYMIELLTKKLGVPLTIQSATSLVQVGYVGKKIESIVEDLLASADYNVDRAERGIVFIDEIDKVRCQGGSGPDVSGEGVQNGLLTMLEGKYYRIYHEKGTFTVNTSKILFIGAGAFVEIIDIARNRLNESTRRGLGFRSPGAESSPSSSDSEVLGRIGVEDFEKFGMIPQFIGRFSAVANLRLLSRDDLRNILTSMENSIIKKQETLFALHGISLSFRSDALEAILDLSNSARTGARGLRSAIYQALRPIAGKISALAESGVSSIVITADTVRAGSEPEYTRSRESEGNVENNRAAVIRKNAFVRNGGVNTNG